MEKRELKNGNGYIQYADSKELKKLFLFDGELVLGLCQDEWAEDVSYFTPAFKNITSKIEECYLTGADSYSGTFKLNDNYSINLQVLPASKTGKKSLSMTLACDSKDIYTLVQNIGNPDAYKTAKEFMNEFMTQWILNLSRDITHQSLFWFYDGDEDNVRESLSKV